MPFARNIELVGYHDLAGRSGFKLAMTEREGRFFLYVAALWEPGWSIVDVTDPTRAELVRWIPGPEGTWTIQVQVAGERMVTSLERIPAGWGNSPAGAAAEGFYVWDIADPTTPRLLGHWKSGAVGTHRNYYDGGRYVHAATTLPGFAEHVYGIVDIDDPEHPVLVGRWWWPGQHVAAGEQLTEPEIAIRASGRPYRFGDGSLHPAVSLHGGAYVAGERAYCPWMRRGLVILDISDVTQPELVSCLPFYPPLGSSISMHTALPLADRRLVVVNSEALNERCGDSLNFGGIVDVSDELDPTLISLFPLPEVPDGYPLASFCDKGGRFGPHNQHQPQNQPCLMPVVDYVYLTYFNAGLQLYDISDPRAPSIAGSYVPDDPVTRRGLLPTDLVTQVEDVLVDRRGYAYISEKNSGITILRFAPPGCPDVS